MAASDEFEQTAQEFFDTWYRLNPVEASWLGIHTYDDQLGDLSADGVQEQAALLNEYVERLASIPIEDLPLNLAVDYQLLVAKLRSGLWSIGKVADWQRNPASYVQEPLMGLLVLVTRDYAPADERAASALARLRRSTEALEAGRVNVTNPPAVFVQTAIQAARGGAGFIRDAVPSLAQHATDIADELSEAVEAASSAFDEYAVYLTDEVAPVASGRLAVGRELFEERLRDWHMLDISADELAATGRRLFDSTVRQLEELAADVAPGREW